MTEVVVEPLSVPAPVEGDKLQATPLLLESWVIVAVMVVACPAARDAPPLEARAMAIGVELLQPATRHRQQTHNTHKKRERVHRTRHGVTPRN